MNLTNATCTLSVFGEKIEQASNQRVGRPEKSDPSTVANKMPLPRLRPAQTRGRKPLQRLRHRAPRKPALPRNGPTAASLVKVKR